VGIWSQLIKATARRLNKHIGDASSLKYGDKILTLNHSLECRRALKKSTVFVHAQYESHEQHQYEVYDVGDEVEARDDLEPPHCAVIFVLEESARVHELEAHGCVYDEKREEVAQYDAPHCEFCASQQINIAIFLVVVDLEGVPCGLVDEENRLVHERLSFEVALEGCVQEDSEGYAQPKKKAHVEAAQCVV